MPFIKDAAWLPVSNDGIPRSGEGLSLTSSSLTLNTRHFSLGLSWKKVELEPEKGSDSQPAAQVRTAQAAPPERRVASGPLMDREEVRRRLELARLLDPERKTITSSPGLSLGPLLGPAPACRAYARAGGLDDDDPHSFTV